VPLHFSAVYPHYKMADVEPTPAETLLKAREIARKEGLKYIYVGNLAVEDGETTFCPECGAVVIERSRFGPVKIHNDTCPKCGAKVDGKIKKIK